MIFFFFLTLKPSQRDFTGRDSVRNIYLQTEGHLKVSMSTEPLPHQAGRHRGRLQHLHGPADTLAETFLFLEEKLDIRER